MRHTTVSPSNTYHFKEPWLSSYWWLSQTFRLPRLSDIKVNCGGLGRGIAAGGLDWPAQLSPQHWTLPEAEIAQAWSFHAETATGWKFRTGLESWRLYNPQQSTLVSFNLRTHVKLSPDSTWETFPIPFGIAIFPSYAWPDQHSNVSSSVIVQMWLSSPTDICLTYSFVMPNLCRMEKPSSKILVSILAKKISTTLLVLCFQAL